MKDESSKPADNTTQLATVPQSKFGVMQSWGFGNMSADYLTTIDESTPAGKSMVFKLLQGQGLAYDEFIGQEIKVVNYLISPVEFVSSDSGEVVRSPLTRIVLQDGTFIQVTSPIVAKTLFLFDAKIRKAPWQPPAVFICRQLKGKGPNKFYQLEPVFDDDVVEKLTRKKPA